MRIILKNANFEVYGLNSISELMNDIATNFGGISDLSPIEHFVKSLGADGSNGIWGKIKGLYMPVLATSTDAEKVFYDIIGKGILKVIEGSYVIEEKRGVSPNPIGISLAQGMEIPAGISNDGVSMFGLVTKSPRLNLQNSAGQLHELLGMRFKWENSAGNSIWDASNDFIQVANETAFTIPAKFVLTSVENGTRTFLSNGLSASGSLLPEGSIFSFGRSVYCDISIFGICEGLTSSEASVIENAIDTFVTEFGVLC